MFFSKTRLSPCLPTTGKVFIVTGGNTGIGYETAKQLALLGGQVIIACRNKHKAKEAIQTMGVSTGRVQYLPIFLDRLNTVKSFVAEFSNKYDRLDGIVCSAGINSSGDPDKDVFAVNFTAHFYLVSMLMDVLRKSGSSESPSRVVALSSAMHVASPISNSTLVPWGDNTASYSRSKLALHMMANYINKHESNNVVGIAVNPGAVNSSIWRGSSSLVQTVSSLLFLTSSQGAQPSVFAMTSHDIVEQQDEFLYVTPYVPCFRCCLKSRTTTTFSCHLFRRGLLLLSNFIEATFGRCLYDSAHWGEASRVACDSKEIDHLWSFALSKIENM